MKKNILLIFLIVIHIPKLAIAGNITNNLINNADSLYNVKKWDASYNLYFQIFNSTKTYSPNMLLKMAFISGQNGDLSNQLFYLCTLYRHHPSSKLLRNIEAISEDNDLQGYSYSDIEYFISVYKHHYDKILISFIVASIIICSYLFIKKMKNNKLGYRPALFLIFLGILYVISNYSLIPPRAIIKKNNCLLMEEPAASSQLMTIANRGNRITLLSKSDVWYLVGWEGSRYYIKETNLLIIPESQPYLF